MIFFIKLAGLASSYAILFSLPPLQPFIFIFWLPVFLFLSLKLFLHLHFKIPLTLDLFYYLKELKTFKDSIRLFQVPLYSLFFLPAFLLSLPLLKLGALFWGSIWSLSLFIQVFLKIKKRALAKSPPLKKIQKDLLHELSQTEKFKLLDKEFPLLRETVFFKGVKEFEKIAPHDAPHVLFIFLESFRAKNVGCLGAKYSMSKEFDSLAKEGALFTNFYANGLQTFRAMVSSFFGIPAHIETMSLKPFCHIPMIGLPSILKKAGYQTAHFQGNPTSFDWSYSLLQKAGIEQVFGEEHFPLGRKTSWGLLDEELFSHAAAFLKKQTHPTFLSLFTISNHHPWIPIIPFSVPKTVSLEEQRFLQTFAYTDLCLGNFIRSLKKDKIFENALIFITADHGQEFDSGPLQSTLSKENVHIPLLITGVTPKRIEKAASQVDLMATVLDLLELKAVHHTTGKSLRRNTNSSAYLSMIRGEKTFGVAQKELKTVFNEKTIKTPLEIKTRDYFSLIEALFKEKKWVPGSLETVSFEIKAPKDGSDSWLKTLESISPILDLSNTRIKNEALFSMQEKQKHLLHELNLSLCKNLSDQALKWLSKNCPNLSTLNISDCSNITEKGIEAIFSLPSLRYLHLENSRISKLSIKKKTALTALHLKGSTHLSGKSLQELTKKTPNLIYFAASLKSTKNKDLNAFCFKNLSYLWLEDGETISSKTMNLFLKKNLNLQILILENFPKIDVLDLQKHKQLTSIRFANCPNLENKTIESLRNLKIRDYGLAHCPKVTIDLALKA